MRAVVVVAPPHVRWQTSGGKVLGQGSKTLQIPDDEKNIVAIDTKREGRIVVPVAPRVEWDALPRANLVVRVLPYATSVQLGQENLGPTPLRPQNVVAGSSATYRVVILKDAQKETRTVKVRPGEETTVSVDLRAATPGR